MSIISPRVYNTDDQIGHCQTNQEEVRSFCRLPNSKQSLEEPSAVPKVLTETPKGKPAAKKRGRPGKKDNKEWQDEEIFMLINIWSTKEELFNCRDERYQNRDNRSKAIDSIKDTLATSGFEVDNKQIQEKLTNLRNYFAAELRKIEASKKSGAGSGSIYKSTWKFFPHLEFLQDNFVPRPTSSNLSTPPDQELQNMPYPVGNAPSAKAAKKMKELQKGAAEKVMETAAKALEKISERREKMNATEKTEDRCFVELLYQMLIEIPECEEKAMAMLQIQQIVIRLRYKSRQSGAPAQVMFGQTYAPFIYNQRNQTPSPASLASVSSEPPMNSGMYQRMMNDEEQW